MAQYMVFGLFKKITSLVLSGKSSYGSLAFCENCMLGKNLFFKLNEMALGQ